MRIYATPEELADIPWNLTIPAQEAQSLLYRATQVIEGLTVTARYAVDDDGLPTELVVAEAMRDAVCAQAVWFDETGDTSGAAARFNSLSLGSFSVSGGGIGAPTNTSAAASRFSPEAIDILRTAGLTNHAPVSQ